MASQNRMGELPFPATPVVIFPNWREVLNRAELLPKVRAGHALAIERYLEYCRFNVLSVTVSSARAYMAGCLRSSRARRSSWPS